jgi:uncharacterized protein (TIGR02569 family)
MSVTQSDRPATHVVAAFGADGVDGEQLPGVSGRVWRHGDIVLKRASDPVSAAWECGVFESLRISAMRVARPVRSLDGRWVVGGWRAERYMSGRPAARYGDIVAAAGGLDRALAGLDVPRFVLERADWYGWVHRLAWDPDAEHGGGFGEGDAARLWFEIAAGRNPVAAPRQVIHGDLFGNVLFAGSAPPAVIGFTPLARPAGYAAALVVVDAVAWGHAPADFATAGQHLAQWGQLLRRACLARLAMVLTHPRATPTAVAALTAAIDRLRPHLG